MERKCQRKGKKQFISLSKKSVFSFRFLFLLLCPPSFHVRVLLHPIKPSNGEIAVAAATSQQPISIHPGESNTRPSNKESTRRQLVLYDVDVVIYSSASALATEAAIWSKAVCPSLVILRPPLLSLVTYFKFCFKA